MICFNVDIYEIYVDNVRYGCQCDKYDGDEVRLFTWAYTNFRCMRPVILYIPNKGIFEFFTLICIPKMI